MPRSKQSDNAAINSRKSTTNPAPEKGCCEHSCGIENGHFLLRCARGPEAFLEAAFQRFPRLGFIQPPCSGSRRMEDATVNLRTWPNSSGNQTLFHNEAMGYCRVSIREFSDAARSGTITSSAWINRRAMSVPGAGPTELAAAEALRVPASATPPTGR